MKLRVAREDLADAVAWVAKSLPSRPPVPVLGGILLEVEGDTLVVAGFDYEVSTRAEVSVDAERGGRVLVSGRLLAEITRALPARPVDIATDGARVSITGGSARFTLPTMPVEDYPALPQMPESAGTVPAGVFAEAVAQTAVSAGRDDTLPMLTGIRVEIEGEKLTLAATDRFRLAVRELAWTPERTGLSTAVLVPARTLADTARSLGSAGTVTVGLGEGLLGLEFAGRRTTVRLLDVEFVKYRSLLPTTHTTTVDVPVGELTEAIRRVALVTDRGHHLRMHVTDGVLTLTAGGDDEGRAEEELPVTADGAELLIAFNPSYLLDGLGVLRTDRVRLAFTTPSRPALLLPVDPEAGPAEGGPDADDGTEPTAAAGRKRGSGGGGGGKDGKDSAARSALDDYRYLVMPARLPG
ncbi:DNA polymerase III subunit beta [Nakamurella endophytica]|uniref:Beta sliding clamp n=1 Tax=Nakamurella endophytica TaxID=1748367 RepID=A0A917SSW7_9ACTN|nr:DNA polymerase III subunit beta [Nakamurella endophytica]GGL97378.1 DNA polymerase III subunit beta [Nakamurella endophytica]